MHAALTLPLLLAATAAVADPLLTGPDFAAHATGRTITFATPDGWPAGTEHYLPGKRVLWHAKGADICKTGRWYEQPFSQGPAICFAYDGELIPVCWYMTLTDQHLSVRRVTDPNAILVETADTAELPCTSPYLGS